MLGLIALLRHRLRWRGQQTLRKTSSESRLGSIMPTNDDLVRGWVSTDCGRGTSDILWSCLATIFLCVWTAIHLPVRYYCGQQSFSPWQKFVRSGIVPALVIAIAPEFLTFTAGYELVLSWRGKEEIRRLTRMDWTLTHQFFVDMGGVCLRSPSGTHLQITNEDVVQTMKRSSSDGKQTVDSPAWISELEKLPEDHIKGLAKSDTTSKLIACGQGLWLVTQVVSRLRQHQAVTLLEVSTCAYVLCAILSYAVWWKKPQGCVLPLIIPCSDNAITELVLVVPSHDETYNEDAWNGLLWAGRRWLIAPDGYTGGWISFLGIFALSPILFGAIHVASWNIELPSNTELWMWRVSSIYCLAVGIAVTMMTPLVADDLKSWVEQALSYLLSVLLAVYVIVRIYMIVEVFLSLRALPRSAFESVQWSSLLPHV